MTGLRPWSTMQYMSQQSEYKTYTYRGDATTLGDLADRLLALGFDVSEVSRWDPEYGVWRSHIRGLPMNRGVEVSDGDTVLVKPPVEAPFLELPKAAEVWRRHLALAAVGCLMAVLCLVAPRRWSRR